MRILILAPHPYYVVRGTPIDLDLVLRVLTERPGTAVDLVCYGEGETKAHANLRIIRTPTLCGFLAGLGPGFSIRKIICDIFMLIHAWRLTRKRHYDLIHAGEESVYIAMLLNALHGIPYAYDLDSSLAEQLTEKMPWLRFAQKIFYRCEKAAVRRALITFPVCNSIGDLCREYGAREVVTLHDISQMENPDREATGMLKQQLNISGLVLLYAGNLEAYQGIDLLLEAFALVLQRTSAVDVVMVGGTATSIAKYRKTCEKLGVAAKVHFLGPKPLSELEEYLAEADILAAPRIRGRNTPMKVFPYLHSGRPVLLTDLPTHTQILSSDVAKLAEPTPESFAEAIVELAQDSDLRRDLGQRGRQFVEQNHTFEWHKKRLNKAYDWIEQQFRPREAITA